MMPTLPPRACPILAAGLLSLSLGCLRSAAPVVFHTLHALSPQTAPAQGQGLAVEVLPVRLPEMLQRSQVVTALGPDSVELTNNDRWANALDKDMQRVVVDNLSQLLGSDRVVPSPFGPRVNAALRVEVAVQRCAGRPGGALRFEATWMITRRGVAQALLLRRTALEEPVGGLDAQALVAAHNRVLAALCLDIAEGLKNGNKMTLAK